MRELCRKGDQHGHMVPTAPSSVSPTEARQGPGRV